MFRQGRFRPLERDDRSENQLNLGETDPSVHTRVRKALAGALSPPAARGGGVRPQRRARPVRAIEMAPGSSYERVRFFMTQGPVRLDGRFSGGAR